MKLNIDAARVRVANKLERLAERVRGDVPWTLDTLRTDEPTTLDYALEVLEQERAVIEGTPVYADLPPYTLRRVIAASRELDASGVRTEQVQTWRAWLYANALPTQYRPEEGTG